MNGVENSRVAAEKSGSEALGIGGEEKRFFLKHFARAVGGDD